MPDHDATEALVRRHVAAVDYGDIEGTHDCDRMAPMTSCHNPQDWIAQLALG